MTVLTGSTPHHLPAGEGPTLWHLGALLTFKTTSATTGGRLWVQEAYGARGYASPMHKHSREDEAFYVLDGELTFYVGDDHLRAAQGSFVWAPRDLPHAFCVESAEARFLAFSPSSELDGFFFATGDPAAEATLPPPAEGPPDIDRLVAALADYGVEMVGPPPAPRG